MFMFVVINFFLALAAITVENVLICSDWLLSDKELNQWSRHKLHQSSCRVGLQSQLYPEERYVPVYVHWSLILISLIQNISGHEKRQKENDLIKSVLS